MAIDEILLAPEVSAMTRLPINTLYHLRAIGKGPKSGKIGKRVVYRRSDVEAFIAAAFAESA